MTAFIDADREVHGVELICVVLQFAPSTYYEHRPRHADPERHSSRACKNDVLSAEIRRVWSVRLSSN
jgi:putative transposase